MSRILLKTKLNLFVLMFFVFTGIVNATNISSAVIYSATYAGDDIVVKSGGTFTINSDAQINSIKVEGGGKLIINSPFTLTVGPSAVDPVVDFQNNSIVNVNTGASLVVNGRLNNSNNSSGVVFDGAVTVNGNVTGGNGSVIAGSGTLNTTGTIITSDGGQPGVIFGSTGDCTTGPCSGNNLCSSFGGSIASSQTICSNSIPSMLTSTTTAGSSATYQWQSSTTSGGGFSDITTNGTDATYTFTSALSQTTYYRLKIKNTCTIVTSQIAITVNPTVTPSVTIAITSGSNPACNGSSVTFTATPTNGGTPTYQWTKNGTNIDGATSSTYTGVAGTDFVSTDIIRCVLIPTAICVSPTTATSAGITMTVNPTVTPSVTIAITSGSNPVCNGSSVTFTATPTSGGTPTYQWTKNGTNIGGATSSTYTGVAGTDFVSTDIIRCVLTSTAICVSPTTATSAGITMTVNPTVTPSVTIAITSGSNPACNGSSVTFTATPTNGGTPIYQWTKNGTNIGGATSSTYTGVAGTDFVSADIIRCVLTSTAICVSPTTATSADITMTVNAASSIVLTSGTQSPAVCSGTAITNTVYTFSGSATNASVSGLPAGLSSLVDTTAKTVTISGTPTASGTYTITTSGHTSPCTAATISGTVTVNSLPNNVSNGFYATTICNGGTPQLTFDADDSTFTSSYYRITYKNNTTSIQYTVDIPYASPFSFTPGDNPNANAGYTLVSISNANCTNSTVASFLDSGANLIVRPIPTASISGSTSVCVGDSFPNIIFDNPKTVAVTVTYTVNGGANQTINIGGNSTSNVTVSSATSGSFVYDLVSVVYQDTPTCSNTLSGSATVTIAAPLTTVSITPTGSQTVCSTGSGSLLTATETGGGVITAHQWGKRSVSGGAITSIGSATGSTYTPTGSDLGVGTWYLVCTSTPTCGSAVTSNEIVVTVNGIPVAPSLSDITLGCEQTTATQTWAAISNISNYRFQVATDAGFLTLLSGYEDLSLPSNVTSLLINGLTSGLTYYVRAKAENACEASAYSSVVSFSVTSAPEQPVAFATQPTCVVSTGTIAVSSPIGAGLTYSIDGSDYSNTTGIFTNVVVGDYYVTVKNTSDCFSVASDKISLNAAGTTTWDGSSWDNDVPDASKRVVFAGDITITSKIDACSCQINSGVSVTVGNPYGTPAYLRDKNANAILKIQNGLEVVGNGKITFENNASLIQVNDAVNSGKIIYKRVTAPMKNFDFTYWSSPIAPQKLYDLSPNTFWDKYYSFNNGAWKVEAYGAANMDPAKGYAIRVPKPNVTYTSNGEYWTGTTYAQPVQFVGVPNNGSITIVTQGANMDNLIGNPYPSPIDADEFIKANAGVIDGGLYFWTHNTAITKNGSFYVYNSDDYAVYTLTGGAETMGNYTDANNNGVYDAGEPVDDSRKPNGMIAAGQSFLVTSNATATGKYFVFNNSMRNTFEVLSSAGSNSQFFRMAQTKKTAALEKSRVWLNLSNSGGAFKQLLVGYVTGATNEMDKLYDAISYDGNTYVDFYSVNNGNNLTIQGRALPFDSGDKVPLGYRSTIAGTFKISIDKVDGVLSNQTIFIEDNVTNTVHSLSQGPYSFSTAKGIFNSRFTLVYVDKNALATGKSTDGTNKSLVVSVKEDQQIILNSLDKPMNTVLLYDLRGRLIFESTNIKSNEYVIEDLNFNDQFLIVMTQLTDGKWITKEIIFKN